MDGWARLVRIETWPLRNTRLDGKILLSGTLQKPETSGLLVLDAEEGHLMGKQMLEHLSLPVRLQTTNAALGPGSALYHEKPVTLSGSIDWGSPQWKGVLRIQGSDLPIALGYGYKALATTDLLLGSIAGQPPVLSGTLRLDKITGSSRVTLTPAFAPPACAVLPEARTAFQDGQSGLKNLQLDLSLRSDGLLPIDGPNDDKHPKTMDDQKTAPDTAGIKFLRPRLGVDMHARGSTLVPVITGTLEVKGLDLRLPCGDFFLPEARVQRTESQALLSGTHAYGMTKDGPCALGLGGSMQQPSISIEGPSGENAPDMMMALVCAENPPDAMIVQASAWGRQNLLFPIPATGWATSRLGDYESGALGFYGSPWNWSVAWEALPQP
jgi:hypothetical protein